MDDTGNRAVSLAGLDRFCRAALTAIVKSLSHAPQDVGTPLH